MSHLSFYLLSVGIWISTITFSQKKWDGGAGNNVWNNALNWNGNSLPVETDNILLDNSTVTGSYVVVLPTLSITVKSITISPAAGRTIELILPAQNTAAPGLTVTGPGYGLIINSGGTFTNSSGATSGNSLKVTDSIKINNDGKYIHNTASGHASNVQVLSSAAGTEKGIFQFDIPAASSTISLSGRTFGKLILKSTAAGGTNNYTAAGSSRVVIRNNMELGPGVSLNLNFSDTIFVSGDLIQEAGTFNLGTSIKSVMLQVEGNITQSVGGVITETGAGRHSIILAGPGTQLVTFKGSILNDVGLVKNGTGLTFLKWPLSLPYKLSLRLGRIITSDDWLLTLQSTCIVEADTLTGAGYIDGPLRKEGLINSGFLFPVGRLTKMRWLRLEQATGSFTVQYFKSDPTSLASSLGSGLDHISSVEYWDVLSGAGSSAIVKLSFVDPYSGGVTNLSNLRVSHLVNNIWQNTGNTNYAGSPGSNGWVSSTSASGFTSTDKSFALASSTGLENPLPFVDITFSAQQIQQYVLFKWKVEQGDIQPGTFELQESEDGKFFKTIRAIKAENKTANYSYAYLCPHINSYYRVRMKSLTGDEWYESAACSIIRDAKEKIQLTGANVASEFIDLSVNSLGNKTFYFSVYNTMGALIKIYRHEVRSGSSLIRLNIAALQSGPYFIRVSPGIANQPALRFVRL